MGPFVERGARQALEGRRARMTTPEWVVTKDKSKNTTRSSFARPAAS